MDEKTSQQTLLQLTLIDTVIVIYLCVCLFIDICTTGLMKCHLKENTDLSL